MAQPANAQAITAEVSFWESVKDTQNPEELQAYLEAYPEGVFSALARIRLKALSAVDNNDVTQDSNTSANNETGNTGDSLSELLEIHAVLGARKDGSAFLGVHWINIPDIARTLTPSIGKGTLLITQVIPDTAAKKAGLRPGDSILKIDGVAAENVNHVQEILARKQFGHEITLSVYRPAKTHSEIIKFFELRAQKKKDMGFSKFVLANLFTYENDDQASLKQIAPLYEQAAQEGNVDALRELGQLYRDGKTVAENIQQAITYYKRAAKKGDVHAMNALGNLYRNSDKVKKDLKESAKWYQQSAESGHAYGMGFIGYYYRWGIGVAKDYKKAKFWLQQASEKESSGAMYELGEIYYNGEGTGKDVNKAYQWFQRSADKGNTSAMVRVGLGYYYGESVPKDHKQAANWFRKGAERGNRWSMSWYAFMLDNGFGTKKDPKLSAHYLLGSYKNGYENVKQVLFSGAKKWKRETRKAIQRQLAKGGYYNGKIDGDIGKGTQRALEAYKQSRNIVAISNSGKKKLPSKKATSKTAAPAGDFGDLSDLDALE